MSYMYVQGIVVIDSVQNYQISVVSIVVYLTNVNLWPPHRDQFN